MKRSLLFLIIIVLFLSGCGVQSQEKTSSTVEYSATNEEKAPADSKHVDSKPVNSKPVLPSVTDGIKIALIDTGISSKAIDENRILQGYNYVSGTNDTEDRINHGTAVASTITGSSQAEVQGIANNAYLIPLVVTDKEEGKTLGVSSDMLATVIRDSIDIFGADIINVSLGIQKDNSALREAIAYADEKGVPVISAVGNNGEDGKAYYPAAYETVLAVGACDKSGKKSDFSQSGADILATGERIMLASRNGISYGIKGTSFATGVVSGYAANLLEKEPRLTPKELYGRLIEEAASQGGYLAFSQ